MDFVVGGVVTSVDMVGTNSTKVQIRQDGRSCTHPRTKGSAAGSSVRGLGSKGVIFECVPAGASTPRGLAVPSGETSRYLPGLEVQYVRQGREKRCPRSDQSLNLDEVPLCDAGSPKSAHCIR